MPWSKTVSLRLSVPLSKLRKQASSIIALADSAVVEISGRPEELVSAITSLRGMSDRWSATVQIGGRESSSPVSVGRVDSALVRFGGRSVIASLRRRADSARTSLGGAKGVK
jgi:hypothetical protein